ncbi:FtsK/SpoIIIE domain-containing protein [Micrococcus luteus]
MAWTVEILGMSGVECWTVSDLPPHSDGQDRAVAERFPDVALERESRRGARLRYIARPRGAHRRGQGPELSLVAASGPDSGQTVPFPREGMTVGRGDSVWRLTDPMAPARPTRLTATSAGLMVDDDGPTPWADHASVSVGATEIIVARGPGRPLSTPGSLPPARVDTSGAPAPMSLTLPAVMAIGPLLLGVVLALTTGRAFFLLFGLLSVVAVATMLGLQHRSRTVFRRRLAERVDDLLAARDRAALEPVGLTRACRSERPDRFSLADAPAPGPARTAPPVVLRWGSAWGDVPLDDPVRQERWRSDTLRRQPALSSLTPGVPVRVRVSGGDHDGALRWMLVQLLLHTSRHGLGLMVHTTDTDRTWRIGSAAGGVYVSLPTEGVLAPLRRSWHRHDTEIAPDAPTAVATATDRWTEVMVSDESRPTSDVGDMVDLVAGTVVLHGNGQKLEDLIPCQTSARTAAWWSAEIASDVAAAAPGSSSADAPVPLRVPETPGRSTALEQLRVPLAHGPTAEAAAPEVDLVGDGPHLLIAGTTGSGKSDLLLGLLTGLCAAHPPSEVALVLLDFKGGASFSCLERLPHTMSVETNHVASASLRALDAIGAELRRREELFASHRVSDYPAFRRRSPGTVLPRLVVAVDELRVLLDEHPDASEVLRRLAATGRSLGFHLVLATQRATGTVTSDIRSNIGSVLCLRTATEQESWDLTGAAVAARIPPDRPGTVVHVRQGQAPCTFRAATWVRSDAPSRWTRRGDAEPAWVEPTRWDDVVEELDAVARSTDPVVPAPILSPPLPESWTPGANSEAALALVDDTASGTHLPLTWEIGTAGGTAWLVERAGGRDQVIAWLRDLLVASGEPVLHLDGLGQSAETPEGWSTWSPDPDPALPDRVISAVADLAESGGTLLVTGWGAWTGLRCPRTYRGMEDLLLQQLTSGAGHRLRVAALGGRDLATSRLIAHLPRRLYVPAGTTVEQRVTWPRLTEVLPVPGRAVLVDPGHPEPGVPAQLAFPAA